MGDTDISKLRQNYTKHELTEALASLDPMSQFSEWFDNALKSGILEPNAMVLSTISGNKPKSRVILLKGFDARGFVFFTNYSSHKGHELAENAFGNMTFFWDQLERQVRIEGKFEKISLEESQEYFWSRPRESQIGAWVSNQSEVIAGREILDEKLAYFQEKFKNEAVVPKPEYWGGYLLRPESIEFWQGRPNRLHDRLLYTLEGNVWKRERLSP